jgi:hypothetical protein
VEADSDSEADSDADSEAEGNGRSAPRIHVPPADLAATPVEAPAEVATTETVEFNGDEPTVDGESAPKRKRSRRGSRGGRKRRKPATAAAGSEDEPGDEEAPPTAELAVAVEEPAEYTPMSEWIGDFETRSRA